MENIRQLTPSSAKTSLRHAMSRRRPVFLWGPPGIGKSDIIHQIGAEMNAHVIDVRLSLWEPTDIKGIPYFDSNLSRMVWAPPVELPDQELARQHEYIILFLDEMNSAPPAVQAAAYQLILNRKVGTYVLPDNVLMIAAGNRDSDKGLTYRMPSPLANRFVHLDMTPDFDDWLVWSVDNKIHQDVVGYLSVFKQDLYNFDPKTSAHAFATPRSWAFVSELLDDNISHETLLNLVSGAVGEGVAIKFMAHRKHSSKLPRPGDVLSGKVTTLETKEISAKYSLIVSLCYELKDVCTKNNKKYIKSLDNFLKYSMDNFDTELVVMGIKLAITQYQLPMPIEDLPNFIEFHKRYFKYIDNAHR